MVPEHGDLELVLDETTAAITAAVGCLMIVANSIAEQEPEHAALLRTVSRKLVATIHKDALEDIIIFAAAVVRDARVGEGSEIGKAH